MGVHFGKLRRPWTPRLKGTLGKFSFLLGRLFQTPFSRTACHILGCVGSQEQEFCWRWSANNKCSQTLEFSWFGNYFCIPVCRLAVSDTVGWSWLILGPQSRIYVFLCRADSLVVFVRGCFLKTEGNGTIPRASRTHLTALLMQSIMLQGC